jgi:hypothetical protein
MTCGILVLLAYSLGALSKYQKARNIDTSKRVRVS